MAELIFPCVFKVFVSGIVDSSQVFHAKICALLSKMYVSYIALTELFSVFILCGCLFQNTVKLLLSKVFVVFQSIQRCLIIFLFIQQLIYNVWRFFLNVQGSLCFWLVGRGVRYFFALIMFGHLKFLRCNLFRCCFCFNFHLFSRFKVSFVCFSGNIAVFPSL